jgi:hypothetical protein
MPFRAFSAQVDKTATNRKRPPCCARLPGGHTAAALPSKMNFRRFICPRWSRGDAERLPVLRARRIGSLHCNKLTWPRVVAGTRIAPRPAQMPTGVDEALVHDTVLEEADDPCVGHGIVKAADICIAPSSPASSGCRRREHPAQDAGFVLAGTRRKTRRSPCRRSPPEPCDCLLDDAYVTCVRPKPCNKICQQWKCGASRYWS